MKKCKRPECNNKVKRKNAKYCSLSCINLGRKRLDMIRDKNPSKKIDIEYDCSYWHTKEKDEKRDKYMKSKGWKVFRFVDKIPSLNEIRGML